MFRTNQTPETDEEMMDGMPPEMQMETPFSMEEADSVVVQADGSIIITEEAGAVAEGEAQVQVIMFGDNLADDDIIDEKELKKIGARIKELVEQDKETRKEWYDTFKKGLQALGIYCPDDETEAGIRRVTHPLLLEAATQFQARAMAELLPPGGPVKTTTVGEESPMIVAQSTRIQRHMNFQLTIEDRTYYDERDQMLFLLAFSGSEFDKQYHNAATGKNVSRWVRCDHFIVPYDAKNLETAPRYTHEIHMSKNDYRRLVAAGFYADDDEGDACETDPIEAPMTEELATLDGQAKPATVDDDDKDVVLYETHIDYDLPGFEDDYALPFVITVKESTGQVVGIRRNWKETDPLKQKRIWFSHKKFLPGFGFYGFGFLHCIGNLGEAATEILRILLDSGAFATLQGGFKSKDCRLPGTVTLQPGMWLDTEMTADELQRSFYTPPFKEPSQVLFSLLGSIVTAGQKFAATTETMTGDAATTGPVGTMVAQIEQGSKVFSGIHKRLHKAFGDEFIHLAELNGEHLPDAYPFVVDGKDQSVLRSDYDGRIDVIPVSDPNIFSSAQRMAMAQTALQLSTQMPDIADRREAAIGMLTAMRFPSPEKIFPKKQEAKRTDPITEGSMVMMGKPIKAFLDQNHQAHNIVHQMQIQQMPEQQRPAMVAHLMEHAAMQQYLTFMQQGVPLPPVEFYPETGEPMYPDVPPQIEVQISMRAAQVVQQMMQQQQAQQAQQAQQEQQAKGGNPQADAAAFQADQQRKDQALAAKVDREDAMAGLSPQLVKQAEDFIAQTGVAMSPRELAVLSKAFGKPFTDVVAALSRMVMAGQGGGPAPIATNFNTTGPRFTGGT